MMAFIILLIDDDVDDRVLFCEALEAVAPEIVCSASEYARSALAKLNTLETEKPDLIFLDINMPVMSGWQCLSILKQQEVSKHIPVIMYSTSSHREDIKKAQELGALCFFTKPYDFKELKKSLAIVVEHLRNHTLSSLVNSSSLFVVPQTNF